MRKPSQITILGQKVQIKYVDEIEDGSFAHYYPDLFMIVVRKHKDWRSTLLHELFHAALAISGTAERMKLADEEALVVLFENAFKNILKLNSKSEKIQYN
jgi:hypothetical protein